MGHQGAVAALQRVLASDTCPHSFLLTGASGVGKTTLARIIADALGAEVLEIDAASNTGVDATKSLIELGQHRSLHGKARKMFILDEAHALSKSSWQALLKTIEEPPGHLYFA